jgi:hypothetical protein
MQACISGSKPHWNKVLADALRILSVGLVSVANAVFELPGGWGVEPPQLFAQPPQT